MFYNMMAALGFSCDQSALVLAIADIHKFAVALPRDGSMLHYKFIRIIDLYATI